MSVNSPGVPLGVWLAELDDERLISLLRLRPDLTQPPPGTIAALAARAAARQSVKAAMDDLDFLQLAVLDALLTVHADTTAVTFAALTEALGGLDPGAVTAAVDALTARALVWGDLSGQGALRVAAEAANGLPWYPGQATRETSPLPPTTSPRHSKRSMRRRAICWTSSSRDPRSGAPATRCPMPRPTAPSSDCSPRGCCADSTPTP